MKVEILIYAYLAICVSMIVFECVCIFAFRCQNSLLRRRSLALEDAMREQLRHIHAGEPVEDGHTAMLRKKLVHVEQLMAFDEALERLSIESPEEIRDYIKSVRPEFICLAIQNHYRDITEGTYFAHVLGKYPILKNNPTPVILGRLMELVREPSLYAREAALKAIYSTGDCGYALQALHMVDMDGRFYHAKLLTDGLLTFGGDKQDLALSLWADFDHFSISMQKVILGFIRFSGCELSPELLRILTDEHRDDELRFSCIRYFGKHPYEQAFPLLLTFVERPWDRRWEYAAVAASALSAYPGERTVAALKGALNSSNWYLRFNAARSLEEFQLTYLNLIDVMDGQDRYAREILQYRLDLRASQDAKDSQEVALV